MVYSFASFFCALIQLVKFRYSGSKCNPHFSKSFHWHKELFFLPGLHWTKSDLITLRISAHSLPSVYVNPASLTLKLRIGIGSDSGHLVKSSSVLSEVSAKTLIDYKVTRLVPKKEEDLLRSLFLLTSHLSNAIHLSNDAGMAMQNKNLSSTSFLLILQALLPLIGITRNRFSVALLKTKLQTKSLIASF